MNKRLFAILGETNGMYIPLYPDRGRQQNLRPKGRNRPVPFPDELTK